MSKDIPTSRPTRKVGKSIKTTPSKTKKSAPKKRAIKKKKPANKPEPVKLEYEIIGKIATLTLAGKVIKLRKWGLSKRLQLGARVGLLIDQIRLFVPEGDQDPDTELVVSVLGHLADDIIFIAVESMTDTFISHAEGAEWIDDFCGPEDLFALGKIIYDMNLKDANQLGKLQKGMESLTVQLNSLLRE